MLDAGDTAVNKTWNLQPSAYAFGCLISPTEIVLHLNKLTLENVPSPKPILHFTFTTESWSCKACEETLNNVHPGCKEWACG